MNDELVKMNYEHLRNETHVEYHDVVSTLINDYSPQSLHVEPQYAVYKSRFGVEVAALDVVHKSGFTGEAVEKDHARDITSHGFGAAVDSALYHFDPLKREAAKKVKIVLKSYGNIAAKALDQETAAIDDLLRELRSADYPVMIDVLGLGEWLNQLEADNQRFKEVMLARYGETAQRPATRMRAARKGVDEAFRALLKQLEAWAANDIAPYEELFRKLNAVTERFKTIAAQQAGARKTAKETSDNSEEK
ncbi:MAG: DUF6261 family protein [Tannerella sp.]|jgi:hypothetical protein|nr:DUF6261 family protein [Tannerella sp.]